MDKLKIRLILKLDIYEHIIIRNNRNRAISNRNLQSEILKNVIINFYQQFILNISHYILIEKNRKENYKTVISQ